MATLRRLAIALGIPIRAFFADAPPPASVLLRRDRRSRTEGAGVALESLAAGLPDRGLEPFMLTLEPGASSHPRPVVHAGHALVLCLQGSALCVLGEDAVELAAGDSLLFQDGQPHQCRNAGPGFATLILVHERLAQERSPRLDL